MSYYPASVPLVGFIWDSGVFIAPRMFSELLSCIFTIYTFWDSGVFIAPRMFSELLPCTSLPLVGFSELLSCPRHYCLQFKREEV